MSRTPQPIVAFLVVDWRLVEVPRSSRLRLLSGARKLGLDPQPGPFNSRRQTFVGGMHFTVEDGERVVVIAPPPAPEAKPEQTLIGRALALIGAKHGGRVRLGCADEVPPLGRGEAAKRNLDPIEVWPPPGVSDERAPCVFELRAGGFVHRDHAMAEHGQLLAAFSLADAHIFEGPVEAFEWVDALGFRACGAVWFLGGLLAERDQSDAALSYDLTEPRTGR